MLHEIAASDLVKEKQSKSPWSRLVGLDHFSLTKSLKPLCHKVVSMVR